MFFMFFMGNATTRVELGVELGIAADVEAWRKCHIDTLVYRVGCGTSSGMVLMSRILGRIFGKYYHDTSMSLLFNLLCGLSAIPLGIQWC